MVSFVDFIIFSLLTVFIIVLCDKNNSPNFLVKILYNSDFKEESSEGDFGNPKQQRPKNSKNNKRGKSKKKEDLSEEMESYLDYSSEEELGDFNPSADADALINEININS